MGQNDRVATALSAIFCALSFIYALPALDEQLTKLKEKVRWDDWQ